MVCKIVYLIISAYPVPVRLAIVKMLPCLKKRLVAEFAGQLIRHSAVT